MYTVGMETMIHRQVNDPIIKDLKNIYERIAKNARLYYSAETISKTAYQAEFKEISEEFKTIIFDRFGFNLKLKSYNTFAVLPLVNTDDKVKPLKITNDIKKIQKQIKEFSEFLEDHTVVIDLEKARIENLKTKWELTYLISPVMLLDLTADDFVAITLHEIGHIFTLIEMYSTTNKTIASLAYGMLSIDPNNELPKRLGITKNKDDKPEDMFVKVYDRVVEPIDKLNIADGKMFDDTDMEYEADDFVNKFGYGSQLTITLNKLSDTDVLTLSKTPYIMLLVSFLQNLLPIVLAAIFFGSKIVFRFTLFIILIRTFLLIGNLLASQNDRNPNGDEHGDLLTRFQKIRLGLINIIRTSGIDKKEYKDFIKQIDIIDNEIEVVNKSVYSSVFGSLIDPLLVPNINIRERLAMELEKLIENDLYLASLKLSTGNEANALENIEPNIYIRISSVWSEYLERLLFKNPNLKEIQNEINDILDEHHYYISLDKDNNVNLKTYDPKARIAKGISGFSIVGTLDKVISFTIDSEKVTYLLRNPYINVYHIDVIKLTEEKNLYCLIVDKAFFSEEEERGDGERNRLFESLDNLSSIMDKLWIEYGMLEIEKIIPAFFKVIMEKKIKLPDEVLIQLRIIGELLDEFKMDGKSSNGLTLDLHGGNFMMVNNKVVIIDPFYNRNSLALKVNNHIDIESNVEAGLEAMKIESEHEGEFTEWCKKQGHKGVNCSCICEAMKTDDKHLHKQAIFAYNFGMKKNGKECKCMEK